jgi:hypothetical protein
LSQERASSQLKQFWPLASHSRNSRMRSTPRDSSRLYWGTCNLILVSWMTPSSHRNSLMLWGYSSIITIKTPTKKRSWTSFRTLSNKTPVTNTTRVKLPNSETLLRISYRKFKLGSMIDYN